MSPSTSTVKWWDGGSLCLQSWRQQAAELLILLGRLACLLAWAKPHWFWKCQRYWTSHVASTWSESLACQQSTIGAAWRRKAQHLMSRRLGWVINSCGAITLRCVSKGKLQVQIWASQHVRVTKNLRWFYRVGQTMTCRIWIRRLLNVLMRI